MNNWIKKSIELANSKGYLDELFDIYPVEVGEIREISEEIKQEIKKIFYSKNKKDLIENFFKFSRFPIDDPYIASLKKHPHLLDKNPKTIDRIGKILLSIELNALLKLATKPKSPSRQLGNSFRKWLHGLKYKFLNEQEFKNYNGVAFLDGSDNDLKNFVKNELRIRGLIRRPDFLFKIKDNYIIGEAKFLTDYGGTQNNQFDGALKMAKIKRDKILGTAVMDGILWFDSNSYMHRTIKKFNNIAISALLLEEFIKGLNS